MKISMYQKYRYIRNIDISKISMSKFFDINISIYRYRKNKNIDISILLKYRKISIYRYIAHPYSSLCSSYSKKLVRQNPVLQLV